MTWLYEAWYKVITNNRLYIKIFFWTQSQSLLIFPLLFSMVNMGKALSSLRVIKFGIPVVPESINGLSYFHFCLIKVYLCQSAVLAFCGDWSVVMAISCTKHCPRDHSIDCLDSPWWSHSFLVVYFSSQADFIFSFFVQNFLLLIITQSLNLLHSYRALFITLHISILQCRRAHAQIYIF